MLYKLAFGDAIPEEKYAKLCVFIKKSIFENIKKYDEVDGRTRTLLLYKLAFGDTIPKETTRNFVFIRSIFENIDVRIIPLATITLFMY